jgi:hypothetical protein
MRFAVDESLHGKLGNEVTIETGIGGGDCGTPLPPGGKFLIFAYKERDGSLWTGLCEENKKLSGDPSDEQIVAEYQALLKKNTVNISGVVGYGKRVQGDIRVDSSAAGMAVHANSEKFTAVTKTAKDGTYEFDDLPNGKYSVTPEVVAGFDFSHEYEDYYHPDIRDGQCARIDFLLLPLPQTQDF